MGHNDDLNAAQVNEWEDKGVMDDVYHRMRHNPCGTEVYILMGHVPACPKCHPEAWKALVSIVE